MRSIDLRGFSGWLESLRRSYVPDDDDLDPLQKFARSLHFAWPTLGPEQRVLQRLQQLCKLKAVAQTPLSYGDHLRGVAEPRNRLPGWTSERNDPKSRVAIANFVRRVLAKFTDLRQFIYPDFPAFPKQLLVCEIIGEQ